MQNIHKYFFIILFLFAPLKGIWYHVCLDPGHCGETDPGALGLNGALEPDESDFNLYMALVCAEILQFQGYNVILTRDDETSPRYRPVDKARVANGERANPDGQRTEAPVRVAVSIHCNSSTDPTARGTETFYGSLIDLFFAQQVHNHTWNYLQTFPYAYNRGIHLRDELAFLRECVMPACLIEVAFVSHYGQWQQLLWNQSGFMDWAATGIADGITAYFSLGFPNPVVRLRFLFPRQKQEFKYNVLKFVWHPTEPNVTYSIYRREHPNPNFVLIASGIQDTIYSDTTIQAGKKYSYYLKSIRGNQQSVRSQIITGQILPFYSDYYQATGLNNSKRIIHTDSAYFLFNYSSDNSIYYSDGNISQLIGSGLFSAIDLDNQNNIHIISAGPSGTGEPPFDDTTFSTITHFKYSMAGWKITSLYTTIDSILSISFAVDPLDTGWVLFNIRKNNLNYLKIGKFYLQEPETLENILTLDTYSGFGKGAISIREQDRSIHIVYEKSGNIIYLKRDNQGNWSAPFFVSQGHNPSLSIGGGLIHIAWEKWEPLCARIQTCYTDGINWGKVQDVAIIPGGLTVGYFPYICKGKVITWHQPAQEAWWLSSQFDIYSSKRTISGNWTYPQNISNTHTTSRYPSVSIYETSAGTNFTYLWTEGNSSPFEIKTLFLNLSENLPLYAFSLGEKEPSIFTEFRDGYIVYNEESEFGKADYAEGCLEYKIPWLEPQKEYLINLTFYQNESEILKEEIIVDNIKLKTIELPKGKIIKEEFFIPQQVYSDGMIKLSIKNPFGKAMLSSFAVFEFCKNKEKEWVRKENYKNIKDEFLQISIQNFSLDKIKISYYLPKSGEVEIMIYSAIGTCLKTVKTIQSQGRHIFIWDCKDKNGKKMPNGIYFVKINFSGYTNIKKMVMLR